MPARPDMRRAAPVAAGSLLALAVVGLWLLAPTTADANVDGDPEVGRELFATHCAACHGSDAQGMGTAPSLVGVPERLGPELAARTVRDGRDGMPAFGSRLDETQIRDLLTHLDRLAADGTVGGRDGFGMPMMHGRWRDMMGGWPASLALLWLTIGVGALVVLALGVVWFTRRTSASDSDASRGAAASSSSPREILDQRYARGELTREEYLQARRDLGDPG
jgi:mono/diheme cytochrome c family protein/uncharacterized membrane protein